jgi:hypothetical protein
MIDLNNSSLWLIKMKLIAHEQEWTIQDCNVAGLPDFFRYKIPKRKTYTKCPQNAPSGHKIYVQFASKILKMAIKVPTSSMARPSKIYPHWDFWFENIPSGHTALYIGMQAFNGTKILQMEPGFPKFRNVLQLWSRKKNFFKNY